MKNPEYGYIGDITARDAGKIGGNMVKKMIEYAEKYSNDLRYGLLGPFLLMFRS